MCTAQSLMRRRWACDRGADGKAQEFRVRGSFSGTLLGGLCLRAGPRGEDSPALRGPRTSGRWQSPFQTPPHWGLQWSEPIFGSEGCLRSSEALTAGTPRGHGQSEPERRHEPTVHVCRSTRLCVANPPPKDHRALSHPRSCHLLSGAQPQELPWATPLLTRQLLSGWGQRRRAVVCLGMVPRAQGERGDSS